MSSFRYPLATLERLYESRLDECKLDLARCRHACDDIEAELARLKAMAAEVGSAWRDGAAKHGVDPVNHGIAMRYLAATQKSLEECGRSKIEADTACERSLDIMARAQRRVERVRMHKARARHAYEMEMNRLSQKEMDADWLIRMGREA